MSKNYLIFKSSQSGYSEKNDEKKIREKLEIISIFGLLKAIIKIGMIMNGD